VTLSLVATRRKLRNLFFPQRCMPPVARRERALGLLVYRAASYESQHSRPLSTPLQHRRKKAQLLSIFRMLTADVVLPAGGGGGGGGHSMRVAPPAFPREKVLVLDAWAYRWAAASVAWLDFFLKLPRRNFRTVGQPVARFFAAQRALRFSASSGSFSRSQIRVLFPLDRSMS